MDATNIDGTPSGNRRSSKRKRSSRTKKQRAAQDKSVEGLMDEGWAKEKDITMNKVFLCSKMIIDGRLHATDKLCVCGDLVVTGKLECEGNFTLQGSVECWNGPATVNNMIIHSIGEISGDVVAKAGVYINGICSVKGALTVTGNLKIKGTLRCTSLNLTGNLEKIGGTSRLIVKHEKIINGFDPAFNELAASLRRYAASGQVHD